MILSLFNGYFLVCIVYIVLNWKMIGNYELRRMWPWYIYETVSSRHLPGKVRTIIEETHSGKETFRIRIKLRTS
jgi:hypothetical protein